MAATVRFDDGALELEVAGDASLSAAVPARRRRRPRRDVVATLPADTAAAFGLGFADGWFADLVDTFASYSGDERRGPDERALRQTGLDLPDDAETLVGDSAALALGSDFDPDAFFSSDDGSDIPIAVKVKGDPDEIEEVLDKLRDMAGPRGERPRVGRRRRHDRDRPERRLPRRRPRRTAAWATTTSSRTWSARPTRRRRCSSSTSTSSRTLIAEAAGDSDQEIVDNLEPLSGFGVTGWVDDDIAHAVLRLTTD